MRMKVPIEGTVLTKAPNHISGDPDDPIRIVGDLGNVSWQLISLDLENEEMEIEVTAPFRVERSGIMEYLSPTERANLVANAKSLADGIPRIPRLKDKTAEVL